MSKLIELNILYAMAYILENDLGKELKKVRPETKMQLLFIIALKIKAIESERI